MIPLALCSVMALAIAMERLWALRKSQVLPAATMRHMDELLRSGDLQSPDEEIRLQARERAERICRESRSSYGNILWSGLSHMGQRRGIIKEAVEECGRQEVNHMERYLSLLGTIAAISPLLGLLGTVLGMMKIFLVITEGGIGNPAALAGGIHEALITTVAGLVIAIPALAMHRYLESRISQHVLELERQAIRLMDHIRSGY